MSPPNRRLVTDALKAFLRTYTNKPMEVARAPTDPNNDQIVLDPPYGIIYPIAGGGFWGPEYADPEDSADFSYQVTSVGLRDDQTQWLADKIREVLVGRNSNGSFLHSLTVTGMVVSDRVIEGGAGGPTLNGRIYSVPDTYMIRVVPA